MSILTKIYAKFSEFCNWIDIKVLGNYFIPVGCAKLGVNASNFVEEKIMNGGVNLTVKVFKRFLVS